MKKVMSQTIKMESRFSSIFVKLLQLFLSESDVLVTKLRNKLVSAEAFATVLRKQFLK